jgi:O-antigen ligase
VRILYSPAALLVGLLVLIGWLPIPLGSNRPWSWTLMHAATMALLGLWCVGYARRSTGVPEAIRENGLALLLLGLWVVYIGVQVLPMSGAILEVLSPNAYEHYATAAKAGFSPGFALSLDRGSSLAELQKISAYVALFFLTIALVTTRGRLRLALLALTLIGTLEALYGILAYLSKDHFGFWSPGIAANSVSGSYVNSNHFAGLMEVTVPAGIALMLAESRASFARNWRGVVNSVTEFLLKPTGWLSFCVLIMCTALILSTSRGGIAALLFGTGFAVALAAMFRGRSAPEYRIVRWTLGLVIVGVGWLGAGGLVDKIGNVGLTSNRQDLREVTMRIIEDFWLTGTGAGTFRWVFPIYKYEAFGSGYYEHAHNDFLELLSEQGIIGFAFAGVAITLLLGRIIVGYARRRDPLMSGALFFAVSGGTAMLAHGWVDFNFNIPANAAMFFVLLGLGAVSARLDSGRARAGVLQGN